MIRARKQSLGLVLALALVAAMSAFAFTAGNTVPDTFAGDGEGEISGYEVSGISYTVEEDETNNEEEITSVAFGLDNEAGTARVSFDGGAWSDCENADESNDWTCDTSATNTSVDSAGQLRVIAHD